MLILFHGDLGSIFMKFPISLFGLSSVCQNGHVFNYYYFLIKKEKKKKKKKMSKKRLFKKKKLEQR